MMDETSDKLLTYVHACHAGMQEANDWALEYLAEQDPALAQRVSDGELRLLTHGVLSLDRMHRLAGPEPEMPRHVNPIDWEHRVEGMVSSHLWAGWQPPPLVVVRNPDGEMHVLDGNQRHAALQRCDEPVWWCILLSQKPPEASPTQGIPSPRDASLELS